MAVVGTTMTFWSSLVMMDTVALEPPKRPAGLPVTSITTGNDETPEVVLASRPIEPTVP